MSHLVRQTARTALRNGVRGSGGAAQAHGPAPSTASHSSYPTTRCLRQQRRWASTEGDSGERRPSQQQKQPESQRSFKGQMMESISQRIAREKADRVRMARQLPLSPSARYAAMTFVVVFASLAGFYIGTTYPQDPDPSSTLPLSKTRPPSYKTGRAELEAAWADFVAIVGRDNVSTDPSDSSAHSTSDYASQRDNEGWRPFCVVYPASTDEVSRIMKVCHGRQIPVVAYSGGTSLEGHFAPTRGGICVDFGRMDKVLQLHADDLDVVVQPAVGWEDLNDVLGEQNLFFPPDPGPGARIGGMIGTGCSGTNAFRYGTMREWVVNLTVVLADGTIIKTRQRPRKSSAGYDLTKLFIGSEGTLGLVTEATLKVATKPASTTVAVASFGTVRQAADCVARVVREGIPVAAVEILDDDQMRYINRAGATTRRWAERPTLFFKFAGTQAGVREQVGLVQRLARTAGSQTFDFARGDEEQQELWSARKAGLWSTFAAREEGGFVWTTDVAVPMSRLPDIIEETKKDMAATGLNGSMLGHVGDGNFHSLILYTPSERKLAEALVHRMVKRAVEMEGTVTGEHGVGLVKRDYLNHELGEATVDTMRKIKLALDPLRLLNPDKVVRIEKPKAGEVSAW